MTDQTPDLITEEIVECAWAAGIADLGSYLRTWDKSALRAALRAVTGDIIEAFGASGSGLS